MKKLRRVRVPGQGAVEAAPITAQHGDDDQQRHDPTVGVGPRQSPRHLHHCGTGEDGEVEDLARIGDPDSSGAEPHDEKRRPQPDEEPRGASPETGDKTWNHADSSSSSPKVNPLRCI